MYNDYPIKNVDLADTNKYTQVDSAGVVVSVSNVDVSGNIFTTLDATSMTITLPDSTFHYAPLNLLPITSGVLPIPHLPYQEYLGFNPMSSTPITFTPPDGYFLLYDGGSHNSVTLNSLGQNILFGIVGGTTAYYVLSVSGTIGSDAPNIVFA